MKNIIYRSSDQCCAGKTIRDKPVERYTEMLKKPLKIDLRIYRFFRRDCSAFGVPYYPRLTFVTLALGANDIRLR